MSKYLVIFLLNLSLSFSLQATLDLEFLANKLFERECGKDKENLVFWNPKEEFPSLGIGHFIWGVEGEDIAYEQQFPLVLATLEKAGYILPAWLKENRSTCPWRSRQEFLQDRRRVLELRDLLWKSQKCQAQFIAERFESVLLQIEKHSSLVKERIEILKKSPKTYFAMLDYSHFKGTGLHAKERYNGFGWGLLQVLQEMEDSQEIDLESFIKSAKSVLARRVVHSPSERHEERFLSGWISRIDGYSK